MISYSIKVQFLILLVIETIQGIYCDLDCAAFVSFQSTCSVRSTITINPSLTLPSSLRGIHIQPSPLFIDSQKQRQQQQCQQHNKINILQSSMRRQRCAYSSSTELGFTLLSSIPPQSELLISGGININIPTLLTQAISGISTYIGLVAYYDRPRGSLKIDESLITMKQSQVKNAGLGLYATCALPSGTILGSYPGVIRPTRSAKFLQKFESIPQTSIYTWRFTDNEACVDPTNKEGLLLDKCYGGSDDYPLSYFIHETLFRWMSVSTVLARINEPPIGGGGCNVRASENLETREVVFELSRDVYAGEEFFMDYGLTYDRSSYGGG